MNGQELDMNQVPSSRFARSCKDFHGEGECCIPCDMDELGERKENISPNPVISSIRLHMKRCVLPQLLHVQTEAGTCYFWHVLGISKSLLGDIFCLRT